MSRTALMALMASLITCAAVATDRFYSDRSAQSPNGRYMAEAKSPANRDGNWHNPFQEDFTVTFKDTKSGKTLWTWRQGKDASPVELIPMDDGKLIMQDAYDGYRVFQADGSSSQPVSAFASIPKKEQEKFADWTTAGVMWQQHSKQGFFTHGKATYFYLRTYWGHIFAISLQDGKGTREKGILKAIEAKVVQDTRDWIREFDDEFFFKCPDCEGDHVKPEITSNLFVIKKHRIREGKAITKKALKKMDDGRNSDIEDYLNRL